MARNGALRHLVQRVGPRGDRLRLERLKLERGGHLRAQHAEEVFVHRHLLDRAAVQHAQRARMVGHRGIGTPHLTGRLRLDACRAGAKRHARRKRRAISNRLMRRAFFMLKLLLCRLFLIYYMRGCPKDRPRREMRGQIASAVLQ